MSKPATIQANLRDLANAMDTTADYLLDKYGPGIALEYVFASKKSGNNFDDPTDLREAADEIERLSRIEYRLKSMRDATLIDYQVWPHSTEKWYRFILEGVSPHE